MLNDKIHSLNEIFDKKRDDFLKLLEDRRREAIAKATVEDVIENLPNMSVGNVLSIFENVSSEVLKTKGGKKTINDFVKMVKEDKNLQNTYMLKENVFSGSISVSARDILVESINTAKENSNTKAKNATSFFILRINFKRENRKFLYIGRNKVKGLQFVVIIFSFPSVPVSRPAPSTHGVHRHCPVSLNA